jgi:hypothetical protein
MKTIVISLLFISLQTFAKQALTMGSYVPYFAKAQSSDRGSTKVFEINPYISYSSLFQFENFIFFPEIGFSYSLADSNQNFKKNYYFFRYMFSTILTNKMILRYGLTTTWIQMTGSGKSTNQRNGDGFQTYYYPSGTRYSYITTFDFGFEMNFKENLTLKFDLEMMSFTNINNSSFNYILGVGRYF